MEKMLLYLTLPMLVRNGAVRQNFRGNLIPVACGITYPFTVFVCYILLFLCGYSLKDDYTFYLTAITSMSFLGFVDDVLGRRDTLGLRGHFSYLLVKKELTTGGLKALGGGIVALYISLFYSRGIGELVVNVLVIALFTNAMNLFDLRPGRCIKAFLFTFLVLAFFVSADYLLFLPILGAVLGYFIYDLKGQVMMGDAGSNVLGITLGLFVVYGAELPVKIVILAFLVALHLLTERFSLTSIIEKNRFLRFLDELGRGEKVEGFSKQEKDA